MEIIAEIGQNHNGDLNLAKEMIHAAKENGAEVAKFQLFDAKALFPKENNPWYSHNLNAELSREDAESLYEHCAKTGIEFMASAFDEERIGWLEAMGVKRHKLASRSIAANNLTKALEQSHKPLLVSLGYWQSENLPEIRSQGGVQFLHCISDILPPWKKSTYPPSTFTDRSKVFLTIPSEFHPALPHLPEEHSSSKSTLQWTKKWMAPTILAASLQMSYFNLVDFATT